MVTLWNPADEAQNLVFRLNYSGGRYLLPVQLGPKATRAFNISDVIRSGTPDAEGNVIPPSAQEGSATLMGSQGKTEHILVTVDAATYNVRKATCGGQCWLCDGISYSWIDIYNFGVGAYGGQTQESFYGRWDDSSQNDYTSLSSWYSDNSSIMTVNTGMVTGQSPGTANVSSYTDNEPIYNPNFCCQSCLYCDTGVGSASPGATVAATLLLRAAGPVSSQDPFGGAYTGLNSTQQLGLIDGQLGPQTTGCVIGNELVGVVNPSTFTGNVTVKRTVLSVACYMNSTPADCRVPTAPYDDTGTWYTSDPQKGGANGQVFNLDSPGIADLSAPSPDVSRIRVNFEAHAVGPDGVTQISPSTTYFVRVSCEAPGATAQFSLDASGNDNQINTGSTPTTWNLQ
jgi:hypothetical protein